MDMLQEIRQKIRSSKDLNNGRGLESILAHIEIAEKHHKRAKLDRDEHLFTDVIYRTNHAFEGILKEAYVVLAEKAADRLTPLEVEEYLLKNNVLRSRVVDLLTNYRKNWRNPSTHDYQLFFSEQEAFLAIVTVSAFASILLDQMTEKIAYQVKYRNLDNAAKLARNEIANFDKLTSIEKVAKILLSYASHYISNFSSMVGLGRSSENAQMAAFVKRVAPEFGVELEGEIEVNDKRISFDLVVSDGDTVIGVDTRDPWVRAVDEFPSDDDAAVKQLVRRLRSAGLGNGIVFFFPGKSSDTAVMTTSSGSWPSDVNLREIYSDDAAKYEYEELEEAVSLVDEER